MGGSRPGEDEPFGLEERVELLRIARRAAERFVRDRTVPQETPSLERLARPGAAFVTLRRDGRLRGCIGYIEPVAPLFRTVQECAAAAAAKDPRFAPVRADEVALLNIEISVLTPLVPISAEDVAVGVHGLMVRKGGCRGVLLPQVAVEQGWDRRTFLANTCLKAGLPPDEWARGAEIFAFTAEVFGEPEEVRGA